MTGKVHQLQPAPSKGACRSPSDKEAVGDGDYYRRQLPQVDSDGFQTIITGRTTPRKLPASTALSTEMPRTGDTTKRAGQSDTPTSETIPVSTRCSCLQDVERQGDVISIGDMRCGFCCWGSSNFTHFLQKQYATLILSE